MMRWIVGKGLRAPRLMLALAVVAIVAGTLLSRASVDALPEFAPPYVEVQTEALGLSAEEVEQLITVPLEADLLHGVAFLDGSARVRARPVVDRHDLRARDRHLRARQVVAERLTQAHALPNVVQAAADAPAAVVDEPGDDGRRSSSTDSR